MVLGSTSPGQSRPLHWLERRSTAPEYPIYRLQHAIPDPAMGTGGAPGVAYSGANGGADFRGLAADVRTSDLLTGNIRGSGAIPRNLLPRGQLGVARQDDGPRQAIQQLRTEPVDQRDFWISVDEEVSRTARGSSMKSAKRLRVDVNLEELDRVLDGARQAPLSEADCDKLKSALHALAAMLARPRNTEKTSAVLEEPQNPETGDGTQPDTDVSLQPGHGRNGAEAFGGARTVDIAHQKLTHGDRCPECGKGNVRSEGAEGAGADRGAGTVGGHGLLAGAVAMRRVRAGVYGARAGRRRSGEVRRNRRGDDRATQVRQRDPVLPVGKTGRSVGDSTTSSDTVGGGRRGRRVA